MTPQQLVGIGLRLFSVWLAISSVSYLASVPAALHASPIEGGQAVALSYAIGGLYLLLALVLWFFPLSFAHKLVPRTRHDNQLSGQATELARVGCSLIGLWALTKALPSLVWLLFRASLTSGSGSSFSGLAPEAKVEVSVALFEALFAVLLIAKAGAFAGLVFPQRAAAPEAPPEP